MSNVIGERERESKDEKRGKKTSKEEEMNELKGLLEDGPRIWQGKCGI